jgi:hypothetical protein
MTEAEWLVCEDPGEMLRHAHRQRHADKSFSGRKLRLLTCGCCRRVWHLLCDPRSREAVESAERYADDPRGRRPLQKARNAAVSAARAVKDAAPGLTKCEWVGGRAQFPDASAVWAAEAAAEVAKSADELDGAFRVLDAVAPWFAVALLRCVFGNLFRPTALDQSWLAWNNGAIRKMAQAVYDDRTFDRLPLLADALEDAGCTDDAILGHCRDSREHARGCWVVDALLGKK